MRPVERGPVPKKADGTPKIYTSYGAFRGDMISRLGQYCSYCNQKMPASLAVEHVQPKAHVPDLELSWDNFLLGCTNCNSNKGDTTVVLSDFIWPDIHNTHTAFIYTPDGKVEINSHLSEPVKNKARNILRLVGLQKYSDSPTASDRRWINRRETFIQANEVLNLYNEALLKGAGPEFIKLIGIVVINNGFFSIWMQVFDSYPEVKKEIINSLPGTAIDAFDQALNPVDRAVEL